MPIEQFSTVGRHDTLEKLREIVAQNFDIVSFLLNGGLDSLNIKRLTADKIYTGTLDAGKVTIHVDYGTGAYITIDKDGMTINDGEKDTFHVDINGQVTMTGAQVQSSDGGEYPRVELNSDELLIGAFQSLNKFLTITPDSFGSTPGINMRNGIGADAQIYLLETLGNNMLNILTVNGAADIAISSGKNLILGSNTSLGYVIRVDSWSTFINSATGRSLQQDLDALAPVSDPVFINSATLPTETFIGSVSSTEISRLAGVTDDIQMQLDSKEGNLGFTAENTANKDMPDGYAGLDSSGLINPSQLPAIAITDTFVVSSQTAMLALAAETGDVAVRTDLNKSFILKGTNPTVLADWQELLTPTSDVTSVFGRSGAVSAQTNDYTWAQINKATSSLADITTRSAADLNSGTLPGARMPALTGDITMTAGSTTTAIAPNVIVDADVNAAAAIGWGKISKTGSSIADLATRSAGDLNSGTLLAARMPSLSGAVTSSAGSTITTLASGIDAAKIADGSVSNAEFQYLNGVTSSIQTQIDSKPTVKIVNGTGTTGTESFSAGFYFSTVDITYSGFISAPKVYASNGSTLGAWITAITPVTTTGATIFLTSTQTGFVSGKTINWTAIGT